MLYHPTCKILYLLLKVGYVRIQELLEEEITMIKWSGKAS